MAHIKPQHISTTNTMSGTEESPRKQQSTSKVIDSLHLQIDALKHELEVQKLSCGDYKKKSSILASKNDSLVDQLANCKHENDMVNALLKRKERRIADLESEFDDISLESESLKHSVKNYKIRCENLQESSASSTAEFERLKISYDALVASQTEYKRHYQEELNKLTSQLDSYKLDSTRAMSDLTAKLENNDRDVDSLLDSLNMKRTSMDNMVVDRNKSILALLSVLAKVAKAHGEECKSILLDNVEIINVLREKTPDIFDKVAERTETTIDVDALLRESALALETSFSSLDTKPPVQDSPRQSTRTVSLQGKKKHRNSMRLSPEASTPELHAQDSLPKQRVSSKGQSSRNSENGHAGLHRLSLKRNSSSQPHGLGLRNASNSRQPLSGLQGNPPQRGTGNFQSRNMSTSGSGATNNHASPNKTNTNNGQNKNSKRRLFHGGNNNSHAGHSDKGLPTRAEETTQ